MKTNYKGKGEHSVIQLEKIIEERETEISELKKQKYETIEMLKYFTAFPDEDFEEDMDKHISFTMTVDARKIKEAKQLIKEVTEPT